MPCSCHKITTMCIVFVEGDRAVSVLDLYVITYIPISHTCDSRSTIKRSRMFCLISFSDWDSTCNPERFYRFSLQMSHNPKDLKTRLEPWKFALCPSQENSQIQGVNLLHISLLLMPIKTITNTRNCVVINPGSLISFFFHFISCRNVFERHPLLMFC